ncbi:tropomyosin-like [Etheostoma cragini]|uniref:tropomyosin-like n=1 Tax=Etheostoma cragini TaxID=417921 RepID=UPI00155ED1B4|nr:tropomyosin-like [Etheostoma cragini]
MEEEIQRLKKIIIDKLEKITVLQVDEQDLSENLQLKNVTKEDIKNNDADLLFKNNQALREELKKEIENIFQDKCYRNAVLQAEKENVNQHAQGTSGPKEALVEDNQSLMTIIEHECKNNAVIKTLKEDVQELPKKLRDGEEVMRRNHETLQQEVQESKDIQQELKVFEHRYTLKEDNESTGKQKNSLEQELQEVKNMLRLEKDLWAQDQLKASQREKALCDEMQTLHTHLKLNMKKVENMQREIESLIESPEVQALKVKTIADQINAEHLSSYSLRKGTDCLQAEFLAVFKDDDEVYLQLQMVPAPGLHSVIG